MFADEITVRNSFVQKRVNLRYIAIFSTKTDCQAPFEWTDNPKELKIYENSVSVQNI